MILITGGSGFVGINLIKELIAEGNKTRCLVRDPSKTKFLIEHGCEIKKGDIRDFASILESIDKEIDVVINLVGILTEPRGATYKEIHVQGLKNLIRACEEKGVKRLLHISALGTRPDAISAYHKTKWEGEELIRSSSLEYTIFRPSVLFGKEDRFTNVFRAALRLSPFVVIPGSGKRLMQPLYVKDLVKMMCGCIRKKEAINKTYEVGGPERLTFDEIIEKIAEGMGKRAFKIHAPIAILSMAAFAAKFLFSKPPISRDALLMLKEDSVTDDVSIEKIFGIKPVDMASGIKNYLS